MFRKRCPDCAQTKPTEEFHKNRSGPGGRESYCKICRNKRSRDFKNKNKDLISAGDKAWRESERGRETKRALQEGYRRRHPEKIRAHNILNTALRDGKISKDPCFFCGTEKVQGHHHDYSKPLDVTWLCSQCHSKFHMLVAA